MAAQLYALITSHPAHAARLMLDHKQVKHRLSYLVPGVHPVQLRAAGFRGPTVPALKLDDARYQGSRQIARALDDLEAGPRLFPIDEWARRDVEDAERWGEEVLQPVPRRIFRWSTAHQQEVRRWLGEVVGVPAAGLVGAINLPLARAFACQSDATNSHVREDLASLPRLLDHVDQLIETGTLAGTAASAADFQIAPTIRLFMGFEQIRAAVESRPAGRLATRLMRDVPFPEPIPVELPAAWLRPLHG